MAENQIEHLPSTFGSLTSLTNLNLSKNKLKYLPSSIASSFVQCDSMPLFVI